MNAAGICATDMFMAAFFISQGCRLKDIRISENGRRIGTFRVTGRDLKKPDREYRTGRALVSPVTLRLSLNQLRDQLLEKINENEGRYDNGNRRKHKYPPETLSPLISPFRRKGGPDHGTSERITHGPGSRIFPHGRSGTARQKVACAGSVRSRTGSRPW